MTDHTSSYMMEADKLLAFLGSSQDDLRRFPPDARRDAGFQLHFVQKGQEPSDWKPMAVVGPGAIEIRIHRLGEWRVVYVARFRGAVYVLHAFEKKTRRTRRSDISLAQARYREACEREKAS